MKVLQSLQFAKAVKKLHANQKSDLDKAVQLLMQDPLIGDRKSGNLGGIRVYKFKMVNQLNLLAYSYEDEVLTLTLLALGSHEKDGVENMEVVLKAVQN
jgi:mRNA-degrading endonuclease YafQ of YafQ-DinJ toxin-antitoxin module